VGAARRRGPRDRPSWPGGRGSGRARRRAAAEGGPGRSRDGRGERRGAHHVFTELAAPRRDAALAADVGRLARGLLARPAPSLRRT
jgi:hypothetical protein